MREMVGCVTPARRSSPTLSAVLLASAVALAAVVQSAPVLAQLAAPTPSPSAPAVTGLPPRAAAEGDMRSTSWPKTIEEFLAGGFLRKSDVVLTSRKGDIASYLIRSATNSPFSHAALIYTGPGLDRGLNATFVIEAGTNGVDLANIKDYAADKSTFIAIKRLRQPWFDDDKRSRVRGLLLENIKSSYNYWAIARIVRDIWFGVERTVRGKEIAVHNFKRREWQRPNAFICSGLVQFGFLETTAELVLAGQLPPWSLRDVMFSGDVENIVPDRAAWEALDAPTRQELIKQVVPYVKEAAAETIESITPDDLANSDRLEWLFMIKDGMVQRVRSYEDVRRQAIQ